jgi:hypothetical protein
MSPYRKAVALLLRVIIVDRFGNTDPHPENAKPKGRTGMASMWIADEPSVTSRGRKIVAA